VGSALATSIALQRCPQLILLPVRMNYYRQISMQIHQILQRHTDVIEPLSLDEAFLDVTQPKQGPASGTLIARVIRREILQETGLTASAGVSYCKFLAKAASGLNKPNTLTVIAPDDAPKFLARLPVDKFFGVGHVTAGKLKDSGIHDAADIRRAGAARLQALLGKPGLQLFDLAHGRDDRPVDPDRVRRSVSSEVTFLDDLQTRAELLEQLPLLAGQVARVLSTSRLLAGTVAVKIKYSDHTLLTRQQSLPVPSDSAATIRLAAAGILQHRVELPLPVRLLGVGAHMLAETENLQQPLFPELFG
jgi:DNA polymerase-4